MPTPDDVGLDLHLLADEAEQELDQYGPDAPGAERRAQALRASARSAVDMTDLLRALGSDL